MPLVVERGRRVVVVSQEKLLPRIVGVAGVDGGLLRHEKSPQPRGVGPGCAHTILKRGCMNFGFQTYRQGGPSGRGLAYVDINFNVLSQYKLLIAKRNFKFEDVTPSEAHLSTGSTNPQTQRLRLGHPDADQVILEDVLQLRDALHAQDVPEAEVVVLQLGVLQKFTEGVDACGGGGGGGGPVVVGAGPPARRRGVARQG